MLDCEPTELEMPQTDAGGAIRLAGSPGEGGQLKTRIFFAIFAPWLLPPRSQAEQENQKFAEDEA